MHSWRCIMDKQLKKLVDLIGFRSFLITVLLLTAFLQFFLMIGNVRGVTYDIQLTELAPETIRSVKTVEDTVKTEQDREAAKKAVESVYEYHDEIAGHRTTLVNTIFDIVLDLKVELAEEDPIPTTEEQVNLLREKLKDILSSQSSLSMSNSQLEILLMASEENLKQTRDKLANLVNKALESPIRKENLSTVRNEFDGKLHGQ